VRHTNEQRACCKPNLKEPLIFMKLGSRDTALRALKQSWIPRKEFISQLQTLKDSQRMGA